MRFALAIIVLVAGTVIPPLKQHFEYVLGATCNGAEVKVSKGTKFRCSGTDKAHLVCDDVIVTVQGKLDDCLQINVVREK